VPGGERSCARTEIIARARPYLRQPGHQSCRQRIRERRGRGTPDHDEVVAQAKQGSRQRCRVGLERKMNQALRFGLAGNFGKGMHGVADVVLTAHIVAGIPFGTKAGHDGRQYLRHVLQHATGFLQSQLMSARGQDQERDRYRDNPADGDAKRAIDGQLDCRFAELGQDHEHQDRRDRRGTKAWADGCGIGQRGDRQGKHAGQREHGCMRHHRRDRAGVDGSADRPDDVIRGRFERSAHARLDHHDGREDGPQPMHRNSEDVRQAEGQKRVDRRLQAKPQAWLVEEVVETGHVALPGLKLRILAQWSGR
jgi:hypothetical protein